MTAQEFVNANINTPFTSLLSKGIANGFTMQEIRVAIRSFAVESAKSTKIVIPNLDAYGQA